MAGLKIIAQPSTEPISVVEAREHLRHWKTFHWQNYANVLRWSYTGR